MTLRRVNALLAFVFTFTFLLTNALGQGSSQRMAPAPAGESDQDQPEKRAEWNMRGRIAPKGESAAALRLRAHQQKMAMRAQRAAAAAAERLVTAAAAPMTWVPLGPSPLASNASGGFQDYNWVSGRATSVLIDPADATGNTVLLGGAYGGLWKSTNAGSKSATPDLVSWQALIDDQPSLAVGAIALQPGNSNVILVGTGETNSSGDSYYGMGILRSTDGGASWQQISSAVSGQSFLGIGFSKIVFSTVNPNLVVATTAGDIGFFFGLEQDGNSTARGLYFSTDAGATWNRVTLSDNAVPASTTGLVYNPSQGASGTFYAAIRRHGIYSSTDGQHFTRLAAQPTAGLASANCPPGSNSAGCHIYRAEFAVTPGRNEMYVWVVDSQSTEIDDGIWTTTDGGTNWSQILDNGITNCGDNFFGANSGCSVQQGVYNLELAAIPNNTGTDIYAGTINIYKCTLASGATTCSQGDWINLTHVYGCQSIALGAPAHVHPDQHGLAFMVVGTTSPGYFAHDGGISRTLDGYTGLNTGLCSGTNQFDSLSQTLGSMTEFVSFSVHPTSADTMLGGTQDNGSPKTGTATISTSWQNAMSGDGGFNAINPNNVSEWFASNPGSIIGICEAGTNCDDNSFNLEAAPPNTIQGFPGNIDVGAFYTPYILDPQNTGEMLIGTCRVWRGTTNPPNGPGVFNQLSKNFDTGTAIACNGGEINQVAALAAGGPKDSNGFSNVVYATTAGGGPFAGMGGGEVWATQNASTTMLSNVTGTINPKNYTISSVAIDTSVANGQTAYVGIMGFHTSHVWKTTDAGTSWTDWTGSGLTGLPDAPVSALLVDSSVTPAQIYAGTDVGAFVSSAANASWTEVGPVPGPGVSGFLPSAPVTAIQMFASGLTKKLRVSTYGRGIWEFALPVQDFSVPLNLAAPPAANPGQTASTTMLISPVGSATFSTNVTYTCSGLPTGASCSFDPTQINAGDAATSVTVAVKTAGPFTGAAAGARPKLRAQKQRLWLPLSLPLVSIVLIGLAGRRLPRRYKIVGLCLALALIGFLVACGGGSSSPPPPPISVTVSPNPVNTLFPSLTGAPAQTQQFTATVHNSANQGVTWAVTGGNANGTIDANGLYTAPAALPNPASVTVTATAAADATKSGSATVNLQTPTPAGASQITVTVTEGTVTHSTTFNLTVN
jgi:hypothetical protein